MLNNAKNSYTFAKFVIELIALSLKCGNILILILSSDGTGFAATL